MLAGNITHTYIEQGAAMNSRDRYDYRELAYDLYKAAGDLLEDLVALRKSRCMTQRQLADEMNVSQSYVSQIENGKTNLVSLLTDYALEVGARITYVVEPAERRSKGSRYTFRQDGITDWHEGRAWNDVSVPSTARMEPSLNAMQFTIVMNPASAPCSAR